MRTLLIARARLLELLRVRYSPEIARTALERAIDDANLPDKPFYSPSEIERIADEFALGPLDRAELIVFLLRREAASANGSDMIAASARSVRSGRGR